ncbi:inner membrane protein YiaA [Ningiella sp. W23]|uniref:inner membrane protein YiaA n=1 Tax=Ningiella sp. W23 TaxID=3023715 RepID=UPI00375685F3
MNIQNTSNPPTKAFRYSAIAALLIGTVSYMIGLFNASMALNEKGYYLALILYGLFSVVSLQKTVRDKSEAIPTSKVYYILAWVSTAIAIALLATGLYNAELLLSEKGFFGMAFTLSLFASITVQKNVRDMQTYKSFQPEQTFDAPSTVKAPENDEESRR